MDSSDDTTIARPRGKRSGSPAPRKPAKTSTRSVKPRGKPVEPPADQLEDVEAMSSQGLPHVHAPHGGVHTWRDFFVHVAIIALGLLLALGLEQIVQAVHRSHQRAELEEQMRETFEANGRIDIQNLQTLEKTRAYLVGLHDAVVARQRGVTATVPSMPQYNYVTLASLGPFVAAQANGTIAVMSVERIQMYNRIAYQHQLMSEALDNYRRSMKELRAFRKRFNTKWASDNVLMGALPPDLEALSATELVNYRDLVADAIEASDMMVVRTRRFEVQTKAMLQGARTEMDLVRAATTDFDVPEAQVAPVEAK